MLFISSLAQFSRYAISSCSVSCLTFVFILELEEATFQQKMKYNISSEEFTEIDVYTCIQGPEVWCNNHHYVIFKTQVCDSIWPFGQILFDATDEEGERSIAALILESLLACPCDTRVPLAQNLLLIGGTALLPGIGTRLRFELNRLIGTTPKYAIFQGKLIRFLPKNFLLGSQP